MNYQLDAFLGYDGKRELILRPRRSRSANFYGVNDGRNKGFRIPEKEEQGPYAAEIYAALEAVRNADTSSTLTIVSCQSFIQNAMNKKLSVWEHEGWVNVRHREVLKCLAAELKARKGSTFFEVVEPGTEARARCREATLLAKQATRGTIVNKIDLSIPDGMALPGMSLSVNGRILRIYVSDNDIWMAARGKDILPRTAQFLWKGLHNAHKVGQYWSHIPECEERAFCQDCRTDEDLEHILTKCGSPGQEIIWREVKAIWTKKNNEWPTPTLGLILGCGLAEFRATERETRGRSDFTAS
ncbi:hypothetical protein B0H13DRAFT_1868495 [Mycena leptocephala]|nr:hypothetical protein B0H13DRAFT_1868495 [Mycena leptocephala]